MREDDERATANSLSDFIFDHAHIRVEHIFREDNRMATQKTIELFREFIVICVPLIAPQRDHPLDGKEAISSVYFAAPSSADAPELLQVQMLFALSMARNLYQLWRDWQDYNILRT